MIAPSDAAVDAGDVMIRPARPDDAAAIARIYNHHVLHTAVTFEEVAVDVDEMAARIRATLALPLPWLVAEAGGGVIGYAYASSWKSRSAYRFTVEGTVYLDERAQGRGIGSRLYRNLIELLRAQGMHLILGGIALPNEASVRLHERLGFEQTAQLKEVGWKLGRWVDVGYWQLIL